MSGRADNLQVGEWLFALLGHFARIWSAVSPWPATATEQQVGAAP